MTCTLLGDVPAAAAGRGDPDAESSEEIQDLTEEIREKLGIRFALEEAGGTDNQTSPRPAVADDRTWSSAMGLLLSDGDSPLRSRRGSAYAR